MWEVGRFRGRSVGSYLSPQACSPLELPRLRRHPEVAAPQDWWGRSANGLIVVTCCSDTWAIHSNVIPSFPECDVFQLDRPANSTIQPVNDRFPFYQYTVPFSS